MPSMLEVAKDVQRATQRAASAKHLDTRPELINNVYPLFMSLLESIDERFQQLEAAVGELLTESETGMSQNVLVALQTAFTAADAVCAKALELNPDNTDVTGLVQKYRDAVEAAAKALEEDEPEEEEDEDDEYEDEEEENDGEEESE